MSFRIAPRPLNDAPLPSKASAAKKCKGYMEWIHELPCVVTGTQPVEAAHLSKAALEYGHLGRGKGRKASDRWALPLCKAEHDRQHSMAELDYWKSVGINPYVAALALWGLWSDFGEDSTAYAVMLLNYHRTTRDA